jgi:hypothetical protein
VRRKLVVNVLLALLVGGLALWMVLRPEAPQEPTHALSDTRAADAKEIRVTRDGLPEIVLQKRGTRWVQTSPFEARTDGPQAQRLLDLLSAQSKVAFPAEDLARFELDRPVARLAIDDQTFAFGMANPLTGDQYVLTRDRVYLVSPVYGYGLPTQVDSMVTHMLLAEDELPTRFVFPAFRVERSEGKWVAAPRAEGTDGVSQDDLVRWTEEWRLSSSLATRPATGPATGEAVRIDLQNGHTIELRVLRRSPELVLRRLDEALDFVFQADKAERLLSPPTAGQ